MNKKNQYDVVFVYEVKQREYESVVLLKLELERRGYSVKILSAWDEAFHLNSPITTHILIMYSMYNDRTFRNSLRYVKNCHKIMNMQWEQIKPRGFDDIPLDKEMFHGATGLARSTCYICWGKHNHDMLTQKYAVPEINTRIIGDISLDFLRPEFIGYFMTKDELLAEFNIPLNKKIVLFISSFSTNISGVTDTYNQHDDLAYNVNTYIETLTRSKEQVISWLKKASIEFPNIVFIYRPHPAELSDGRLSDLFSDCPNIRLIDKYSVRQWILVSDKIFVWLSTTIKELCFLNKEFGVLRPLPVERRTDYKIYDVFDHIKDYTSFAKALSTSKLINNSSISDYVLIDPNTPTYKKICDYIEDVYRSDTYNSDIIYPCLPFRVFCRFLYNFKISLKKELVIRKCLSPIGVLIWGKEGYNIKKEEYYYQCKLKAKNHVAQAENDEIISKIKKIIEATP